MIAIRVQKQKNFMAKLLTTGLFDEYLVEEISIDTYNTFTIDGRIHKEFYKDAESAGEAVPAEEFSKWEKLRPICLELIKGKQTPLSFKFILRLNSQQKEKLFNNIDSDISKDQADFGINIKFSSGEVVITTGVSYSIFTLDKEAEKAWDSYVPSFLESNGIETDLL
ncbi:hypothetical protein D6855_02160 [Butyrivibrio sp. CB08]|uniref:DUF5721 family protein n=1 Tax=Butyrivibrio sp. CB08 TaxID=2364879 RepID=UPI000EA9A2C5|nr:DUF5721 family protein [Butyrivibrio sp. CB08]RKM62245.1 hypothetical protein D6855_02160 [Butyrivibrio sp. CB08]